MKCPANILCVVFVNLMTACTSLTKPKQDEGTSSEAPLPAKPSPTVAPSAKQMEKQAAPIPNPNNQEPSQENMPKLEMTDQVVGKGKEAKAGDTIKVHYTGTFTDGKKFDSSLDRKQPFEFVLGSRSVIKGWDQGIVGMKVGGKRKLVIPPILAYGSSPRGPIPANSTLLFDVELLEVTSPGQATQNGTTGKR